MQTQPDVEYLKMAYAEARKSGDLSTQNGAVIVDGSGGVVAWGHNDIPHPVCVTPERRQRPLKYQFTDHAEAGAIHYAARHGVPCEGATLYCPWLACDRCGVAIVAAGIKRVVRHKIPQHASRPDWAASIAAADEMFREAGVEVVEYVGELGETFRFNGEEIRV